jgi:twitching motility two-component system response regulator PilG
VEPSKAFHSSRNALFLVVIDDSAVVCRILEALLTKEGHQVECFLDPVSALRSILVTGATPLPDLLFIDLSLPTLNGYEVIQRFKTNPASMHIPVVVISRRDDTISRLKARLAGATAYLPKPFAVQDVLALVRNVAVPPNSNTAGNNQ